MHLSLLSDGFVSDSFNDAGIAGDGSDRGRSGSLHFVALLRGVIVMAALALPLAAAFLSAASSDAAQTSDGVRPLVGRVVAPGLKGQG